MIGANILSTYAEIYVYGNANQRNESARFIRNVIERNDYTYAGDGKWKLYNPHKYAEKIPALRVAIDDYMAQVPMFSATEIARMQDQKYAKFFFHLTNLEQLVILKCAYQGLADELMDGHMREHGQLDNMKDEYLEPIKDKLEQFINGDEGSRQHTE